MENKTIMQLLFSAKGRLNRQKLIVSLFLWAIVVFGMMIISSIFSTMACDPEASSIITVLMGLSWFIYLVLSIACVYSTIVLQIKRWHDLDKSGWFFLLGFIPIVGVVCGVYLLFIKGTDGDNRFGKDPLLS